MEELMKLIAIHESLPIPESAQDDILDDLLFLVFDLETMVMGYVDALIGNVDPGFELDAAQAEVFLQKLMALDSLGEEDRIVQEQIAHLLRSLIRVRDQLSQMD